ncbi:MAG: carboxypeptidase regulatory-like domain-containing protein [Planctomycetes bacterium]|nr:carboxypeptidase regulatory-like domain-containing protein [Planctomycetota bacterium]
MRRVLALSLLGTAVLAVVLYVVFSKSGDDGLSDGTANGGQSQTELAQADANSDGSKDQNSLGDSNADADGNRTEVGQASPLPQDAEPAKASLRLRLVNSESNAAAQSHAELKYGNHGQGFEFAPAFLLNEGEDEPEDSLDADADETGLVVLEGLEAGRDLSLSLGGPYWAKRSMPVAALEPGEERDLGELILAPGVLLSGHIFGPNGKGIEGAAIQLVDRNKNNQFGFSFGGNAPGPSTALATTDKDGFFFVEGVRLGEYTLEANANGYVQASTSINLNEGRADHSVELHLATGGIVTGVVRDHNGKPLPSARVVLVRSRGYSTYQWDHDRIMKDGQAVDEDGSFALGGLASEGKWRVAAAAPGYARGRTDSVSPGSKMEVKLEPRLELRGTVHDAHGNPVEGATVTLTAQTSDSNRDYFNRNSADCDETGTFVLDDLKEGIFNLEVTSAQGVVSQENIEIRPDAEPLALVLPEANALIITVIDDKDVPLQDVRVSLSTELGAPQSEVVIGGDSGGRIMRSYGGSAPQPRHTKTNELGQAYFYGLTSGDWDVKANLKTFAAANQTLKIKENTEQQETVVLYPASKVRLTAIDATGQIVAGARVVLSQEGEGGFGSRPAVTDPWGLAVWSGLAPGQYRISESQSPASGLVFFDMEENEEKEAAEPANDVVFNLEAGVLSEQKIMMAAKAVASVLVTRLGTPVAAVTVELASPNDDNGFGYFGNMGGSSSGTTNAQGMATLPPCDAGEYTLKARATSTSPATEMKVNLAPGQQQIVVELASGVLTGTVVGTSGPVSGAEVRLGNRSEDGTTQQGRVAISFTSFNSGGDDDDDEIQTIDFSPGQTTARTDDKGQFRFQDVPAGDYEVKVIAKGLITETAEVGAFDGAGQKDLGIVQLYAGGSLTGKVVGLPAKGNDPNSRSMDLLQLYDEENNPVHMSVLGKNSSYDFKDLKPGSYVLGIHVNGEMVKSDPILVQAGNPTNYTFTL